MMRSSMVLSVRLANRERTDIIIQSASLAATKDPMTKSPAWKAVFCVSVNSISK